MVIPYAFESVNTVIMSITICILAAIVWHLLGVIVDRDRPRVGLDKPPAPAAHADADAYARAVVAVRFALPQFFAAPLQALADADVLPLPPLSPPADGCEFDPDYDPDNGEHENGRFHYRGSNGKYNRRTCYGCGMAERQRVSPTGVMQPWVYMGYGNDP